MLKPIGLYFLLSIIGTTFANTDHQFFTMAHSTCETHIFYQFDGFNDRDQENMKQRVQSSLEQKGFKINVHESTDNRAQRVLSEELYFEVKMSREGWLYKNCLLDMKLKEARSSGRTRQDRVLHKAEINRQFPRVTFKGNERCVRAISDALIHIPVCRAR